METQTQEVGVATYDVDPVHSQVKFHVKHLGFSTVTGEFGDFEGQFQVDPQNLETLEAEATIDAASVDTGGEERDQHLRSDDFFAVEDHPTLQFESTGVQEVDGDSVMLQGDLTIRGVTKPVELDVTFLGEAQDPWGGQRVAFEATTTINRKEYGLTWNQALETGGLLVGEQVQIALDVQGVRREE